MIVEVINRPYRRFKVGERFKVKEKEARILVLLKRVKISDDQKLEAPPEAPQLVVEEPEKKKRGRKPGSKNKPKPTGE